MSAGKLVGIDLGTTFSAIATLDDKGQAVTLPNAEGEMLTPSVVLIEDGEAVVGQAARDVALEHPDRVAALIKRRMGHASFGQPVTGREFRPETLAAVILRKISGSGNAFCDLLVLCCDQFHARADAIAIAFGPSERDRQPVVCVFRSVV